VENRVEHVRVGVGSASVYIEARELAGRYASDTVGVEERDIAGARPTLDGVVSAIKEFAAELAVALEGSGASRAAVEFGCEFALETGHLVAVLGKASAKSSLKVTLEWDKTAP
jgi:hypothetical protein